MKEIIEKYPKIFQDYEGNPGRINWADVPEGWLWLVDNLCGKLQYDIDHHNRPQVCCTQVKDKFGGLRFYVDEATNEQYGVIAFAEHLSYSICENCGSTKNVNQRTKHGWISTLCETCTG